MGSRVGLDDNVLEMINGGGLGYDPDSSGTFTMKCQYSGNIYYGIRLDQVMEIAKYSAAIPDTPEGEADILNWAHTQGII